MKHLTVVVALVALVATGAACGFRYLPTDASNDVETTLLSETARAAGALSVNVHGEMTNTIAKGQCPPGQEAPVGWYQAGVAWYYRPQVARFVSIEVEAGKETARNVAGHEVCHHESSFHDLKHWECMRDVAAPTYPRPGASGVWTGAAFTRLDVAGPGDVH